MDIRLHISYFRNHKTIKLMRQFGGEGIVAHLRLLLWARENRPNGVLTNLDLEDISTTAQTNEETINYMKKIGLLDKNNHGTFIIHDWQEWNPFLIGEEKRKEKARNAANVRWNRFGGEFGKKREKIDRAQRQTNQGFADDGDATSNASSNASSNAQAYAKGCFLGGMSGENREKSGEKREKIDRAQRQTNQWFADDGDATSNASSMLRAMPDPIRINNKDIYRGAENTETDSREEIPSPESRKAGECPYSEIINLYHKICPELPPLNSLGEEAKKNMKARWVSNKEKRSLQWWEDYFKRVAASDYLMGKLNNWSATLNWLVRKSKMESVLAGEYDNRGKCNNGIKPGRGGRPAEQDELDSEEEREALKQQIRRRRGIIKH